MLRILFVAILLTGAALLIAPHSAAQDQNADPRWGHQTLDAGTQAAKRSERPVLLLTIWRPGV